LHAISGFFDFTIGGGVALHRYFHESRGSIEQFGFSGISGIVAIYIGVCCGYNG